MNVVDRFGHAATAQAFAPSAAEVPMLRERLRQLRIDVPILTSPVMAQTGAARGQALLWSWTASGIEALGRFAEACHELDLALLVGIARWVPLDTVLGELAAAGLRLRAAKRVDVGGHRGVELRLTREEVPAPQVALALLELVTWSAPWHRGRQQPLRLAIEGATPHDLRDHPHACDLRAIWRASPGALRLASPEILLIGEQGEYPPDPAVSEALSDWGTLGVACLPTGIDDALHRPTLASETLLLAPHGIRARAPSTSPGVSAAVLEQLAAGLPIDLPPEEQRQLAPEVVAAAEGLADVALSTVRGMRAKTRLRWSVLRHHSAVSLVASLEARTGRVLASRPWMSLCLDGTARGNTTLPDAVVRQLAAQRRRPDEVVLLVAEGSTTADALRARLQRALGIEVRVVSRAAVRRVTGDLVVVTPLDALLAADALADLELAYRLWSPTVSVIPTEFVIDDAGRLHRSRTRSPEGLGVPVTSGVVAVAGRELRAHWRHEAFVLGRWEELLAGAVERGAMIYTMPSVRAVFQGTPATLACARPLDIEADSLFVADRAVR